MCINRGKIALFFCGKLFAQNVELHKNWREKEKHPLGGGVLFESFRLGGIVGPWCMVAGCGPGVTGRSGRMRCRSVDDAVRFGLAVHDKVAKHRQQSANSEERGNNQAEVIDADHVGKQSAQGNERERTCRQADGNDDSYEIVAPILPIFAHLIFVGGVGREQRLSAGRSAKKPVVDKSSGQNQADAVKNERLEYGHGKPPNWKGTVNSSIIAYFVNIAKQKQYSNRVEKCNSAIFVQEKKTATKQSSLFGGR